MAIIKKSEYQGWRGCGEGENEHLCTVSGVQINAATLEISLETSQKFKIELVYMPQINSSWANT